MSHTPGPWKIGSINTGWIVNCKELAVASVYPVGTNDSGDKIEKEILERTANCNLIAAAPCLLEALKECRIDYIEALNGMEAYKAIVGLNSSGIVERIQDEQRINLIESKLFQLNEIIKKAEGK